MKLGLIPARGGSKRIPRKNIRLFRSRPIIAYAIEAARDCGLLDRIVVSTDDDEIAEVAHRLGAEVPFRRPPHLADDYATAIDVMRHALGWAENEGLALSHLCCLYPTAPLIRPGDIIHAFELMVEEGADYCFPVTEFPFPIQRAVRIGPDEPATALMRVSRLSSVRSSRRIGATLPWSVASTDPAPARSAGFPPTSPWSEPSRRSRTRTGLPRS